MSKHVVYQVVDWDKNFEGYKSRTYEHKSACQMPTKHGLGYKRIIRRKNGPALFGAWCALIQILSRHHRPRQGYCTDTGLPTGKPYTDSDLEVLTDIPSAYFRELFEVATAQDVGWLRISDGYHKDTARIPQGYHRGLRYPLDLDLNSDSNSDSDSNSCRQKTAGGAVGLDFEKFWSAYPKKVGKQDAIRAWTSSAKNRPVIDAILNAVESAKGSDQWRKDGGRYIPNPATWILRGGWDDDLASVVIQAQVATL